MTTDKTMSNFTHYNISIEGTELQAAEDRAEEIQSLLYHAKAIFQAFSEDEIGADVMRSVSVLCARSLNQIAELEADQNVKFLMKLNSQYKKYETHNNEQRAKCLTVKELGWFENDTK